MAGLQRSAVSFRRQGSSGSVFDDRFIRELNRMSQKEQEQKQGLRDQEQDKDRSKEALTSAPVPINTIERSRSNSRERRGYRTGLASPTIDPPSPKVTACGFCSAFGKPGNSKKENDPRTNKPAGKLRSW